MNLCSRNHEEVCFEGRNCPFCAVIEEKEAEVEKLTSEISQHKETISKLRNEIDNPPQ